MTTPSAATLTHYGWFALAAEEAWDKEHQDQHKPITVPDGYRVLFPIQAEASILGIGDGLQFFGFVAKQDETGDLVVSWRGTEGWKDWVDDLEALDTIHFPYGNAGKIAQGFHDLYTSAPCRDPLIEALRPEVAAARAVHVTGHSLGGALAVINGLDVALNLGCQPHVWTFAGPRVGRRSFAQAFDHAVADCVRVVNKNDIVPKVPPWWLFYRHVKGKYVVDSDGFAKHNIGCRHSMRSYLHALDPSVALSPDCVPEGG